MTDEHEPELILVEVEKEDLEREEKERQALIALILEELAKKSL